MQMTWENLTKFFTWALSIPMRTGLVFLASLFLVGCSTTMRPITTGFHVAEDGGFGGSPQRYVIWSNHAGAEYTLASELMEWKHTVVERARLTQVMAEQHLRLMWTPESEADLLRVGHLVGATRILFVQVQPKSMGVLLRSVDVETARVRWTGTGYFPEAPARPDLAANFLAAWTMLHAVCPTEKGWIWTDDRGCTKR
jgi:hypothetical protein